MLVGTSLVTGASLDWLVSAHSVVVGPAFKEGMIVISWLTFAFKNDFNPYMAPTEIIHGISSVTCRLSSQRNFSFTRTVSTNVRDLCSLLARSPNNLSVIARADSELYREIVTNASQNLEINACKIYNMPFSLDRNAMLLDVATPPRRHLNVMPEDEQSPNLQVVWSRTSQRPIWCAFPSLKFSSIEHPVSNRRSPWKYPPGPCTLTVTKAASSSVSWATLNAPTDKDVGCNSGVGETRSGIFFTVKSPFWHTSSVVVHDWKRAILWDDGIIQHPYQCYCKLKKDHLKYLSLVALKIWRSFSMYTESQMSPFS